MTTSDKRYQDLQQWLTTVLHNDNFACLPLAGDAGQRRYFRLNFHHQSYVAVDTPPAHTDNHAFITIGDTLSAAGICVPQVLHTNFEQGFMLLSDFGDELLLLHVSDQSADALYQQAFEMLLKIQQCPRATWMSSFDQAGLQTGLQLFNTWFVEKHLSIALSVNQQKLLQQVYTAITEMALSQPQCFSHRDFHSRNLMLLDSGKLAVIDYQDASWGPCTYDLLSLLKDCYIDWPREKILPLVLQYQMAATDAGILKAHSAEQFIQWFDWMGVQRHLRVLGTFARLSLRDEKPAYLQHVPRILDYLHEATELYPKLHALNQFLCTTIIPANEEKLCQML